LTLSLSPAGRSSVEVHRAGFYCSVTDRYGPVGRPYLRRKIMKPVVCAIVLGLALVGCSSTGGGNGNGNGNDNGNSNGNDNGNANSNDNGTAGTVDVSIRNFAFDPSAVTVHLGDTVRWTNNETSPMAHTATSGNPGDADAGAVFDSGTLDPSESFSWTADQTGTFTYYCIFHPTIMRGATVTVEP
jgi:plastocyanin